jgi:UDP-GlcNAc3NAcA epimerase
MPEEINRILTDHAAELLFAPTNTAVSNLKNEGLNDKTQLVGDVMHDAALFYRDIAEAKSNILSKLHLNDYILATVHRAENTDDEQILKKIVKGLQALSENITIVLPLHPRTAQALRKFSLLGYLKHNIKLIEPVGYLDMVMLEKHAKLIVTDSGGVQKEAFFHQIPCIILRDSTEWIELLELGWNRLVTLNEMHLLPQICHHLMGVQREKTAPCGAGNSAAQQIVDILASKKLKN